MSRLDRSSGTCSTVSRRTDAESDRRRDRALTYRRPLSASQAAVVPGAGNQGAPATRKSRGNGLFRYARARARRSPATGGAPAVPSTTKALPHHAATEAPGDLRPLDRSGYTCAAQRRAMGQGVQGRLPQLRLSWQGLGARTRQAMGMALHRVRPPRRAAGSVARSRGTLAAHLAGCCANKQQQPATTPDARFPMKICG